MWRFRSEELADGNGLRFMVDFNDQPATYAQVVRAWTESGPFRTEFNAMLANAPYTAFRWETPAVAANTADKAFEFVLLASPGLAAHPDPKPFAEHFHDANDSDIVTFSNLRGDAVLVVPCPGADPSAYGHIAAFVRFAPEQQRHGLWRAVGEALARRLGDRTVWLSTAGAGVSWLHVRLDDRPKYYGFAPYQCK